ncbi:MAG: hypothetical protein ACKVX7_05050 [Planctomycetota bacterium]
MPRAKLLLVLLLLLSTACRSVSAPEAVSLDGRSLYAPTLNAEELAKKQHQLEEARRAYELAPDDVDAVVWFGRRLAYLGRFRAAIEVFDEGLRKHPNNHILLRHRGHRWITVREFERAITDLELAAAATERTPDAVEPDGAPNVRNTPISSSHSNIWYHLALAYFVSGRFEDAERAARAGLRFATNPDKVCSTRHWLFMAMARQGRLAEAQRDLASADIRDDWDLLENQNYHQLLRMYLGRRTADDLLTEAAEMSGANAAAIRFGVGHWFLCQGERAKAKTIFQQVVADSPWTAFGHIAAEVELGRMAAATR